MSENASEGTEQLELPAATSIRMSGGSPGDQPPTEPPNADATEQILPSITKPKSNRSSTINNDQQFQTIPSPHTQVPMPINKSAADNPRAPSNFGPSSRFPEFQTIPPPHASPPMPTNRSAADNPRAPSNFGPSSRFPDYKCYPTDEASPSKYQMPESNREGCT